MSLRQDVERLGRPATGCSSFNFNSSICYRPRRGINVKYIWENCAKSTERKFRASTISRAYNSQEICRPKKCEIIRKNGQIILREVLYRFYALSLSVLMFKLITKIYWLTGWVTEKAALTCSLWNYTLYNKIKKVNVSLQKI